MSWEFRMKAQVRFYKYRVFFKNLIAVLLILCIGNSCTVCIPLEGQNEFYYKASDSPDQLTSETASGKEIDKKPWYSKWWVWVIAAGIGTGTILIMSGQDNSTADKDILPPFPPNPER